MSQIAKTQKPITWQIGIYIRLSKEDGNDESCSIINQKKIIIEFLENYFEDAYCIVDFYIDDGITGTDYDRPDFQRMLRDMESKKITCIISKNLSRMFRNYSDQGYFLEKIFPIYKIRFITVSEPKVDSYLHPEMIHGLEIPINGLMNDRYAAKTSKDIRDTFDTKRRKGEFIGAFAPYGYIKNPSDKNCFVIDHEAAQIVQDIYHWFVNEGLSKNGIAKRLNEYAIPNPTAYKQSKGLKYNNPQSYKNDSLWSSATVTAILKNRMYIGTMVQGKQAVISYKVHTKITLPQKDWYIVDGTHEPIIEKELFYKAQSLQERNTRTAPGKHELYLFAGFIRCADCQKAMVRQNTKGIVYYYCRTFRDKSKSFCSKHTVKEESLKNILLLIIQKQIELIGGTSNILEPMQAISPISNQSKRLSNVLKLKNSELNKTIHFIDNLYGDWKLGHITQEEYHRLKNKFEIQLHQLKQSIENIEKENTLLLTDSSSNTAYLASHRKQNTVNSLNRAIMIALVNTIYIHANGEIEINLNFADQNICVLNH